MKTIKNLTADELRKSILQLAIQGKLVKQDPSDEPASELVKRIYEEKNKLIAEGKIKKDKNQSYIFKGDDNCYYEKIGNNDPVKLEDLPFDIPENWTFIKLESFTHSIGNKNNQIQSKDIKKSGKYPVVSQSQNLIDGYHDDNTKLIHIVENDPIILFGDHTRNIKLINFSFIIGADGTKLFKPIFVNINYLFYCLTYVAYKLRNRGYARHYSLLKSEYIPLPPLEEQQRIVDKINSFEPLLEKYDKVEKELSKLEKEFSEKLKKSILQYAIEGKLVKQDPNDEPASVLLERIRQEKERLIKEGKIKRDKNESYIYQGDDKNYYEHLPIIPQNWLYVNLGNLGTLTRGNGIKRNETTQKGYPCVRYGELYTTYKTFFHKAISFTNLNLFNKSKKIKKNDIIMSLTGENKEDISKAVAYLGEDEIAMGGDMTCFSNHILEPLYLVYVLNSPYGISRKRELATGDIIVHMSNDKLSSIKIPLPPLYEQKRIVYKIDFINRLLG